MSEQPPLKQGPADYRALLIGARAASRLTYEEISRATGLRPAYLEALERGTLESMVAQPYVRSMLTCYGSHLGLDPDALLRSYEAAVDPSPMPTGDATGHPPGPSATRRAGGRPNGPRRRSKREWLALWPALGVALAGVVISVVVLDPLRLDLVGRLGGRHPITTTTSTSAVETVAPTTTTQPTSTTKPKKHTVRIVPTDDVWLELTSESGGTVLFRGMRKAGEELSFSVLGPLKATVGRPQAVKVFLNGEQTPLPRATLWLITATEVRERPPG
ncbi:MAG: helix-turn-helix domain-containing protein [Thermoleophilia bacterium]